MSPQRDPVREAFGETALLKLTVKHIRLGLEKLDLMQLDNIEAMKAIRSRTVNGIMEGTADAIGAVLNPDGEMQEAQRWQEAISTAKEAAEQAMGIVDKREKSANANQRRAQLIEALRRRQRAAERLQAAVLQVAEAFHDVDLAGVAAVQVGGVRISGVGIGAQVARHDHTQHLINLALHRESGGLWVYERVPNGRAIRPLAEEFENVGLSLLSEFQEKLEKQVGYDIDWDAVPEPTDAGA